MPKVNKGKSGSRPDKGKERPIHPYSRKAVKLGKQALHEKKIDSARNSQISKLELVAEKLQWFKDHLDDRHIYTKRDLIDLVMQYRNRFEDELEQIKIIQDVGSRQAQSRQHASRESAIRITIENETHQFEGSGMEVPDLINKKHLEEFKLWNGQLNLIQNLKLRKISDRDLQKVESQLKESSRDETIDDTEIV